jgi:hypothetical protein
MSPVDRDEQQPNSGRGGEDPFRARDLLGALFFYVLISVGYGVWGVTHGAAWAQLATPGSVVFLEHCLGWPRLLVSGVQTAVSQM